MKDFAIRFIEKKIQDLRLEQAKYKAYFEKETDPMDKGAWWATYKRIDSEISGLTTVLEILDGKRKTAV